MGHGLACVVSDTRRRSGLENRLPSSQRLAVLLGGDASLVACKDMDRQQNQHTHHPAEYQSGEYRSMQRLMLWFSLSPC